MARTVKKKKPQKDTQVRYAVDSVDPVINKYGQMNALRRIKTRNLTKKIRIQFNEFP